MDFKKILIINPYGIGDVLFTTPVIRNLRQAYPLAPIAYLANRRNADFLATNPDIHQVFVYERDEFVDVYRRNPLAFAKKWFGLFQSLKKENFDLVLDYSLNSTFGFLCALCGIKRRVGFDYRKRGRFLTDKIPFSGYEDKHIIEYDLDLLRHLGVGISSNEMRCPIPDKEHQWALSWLSQNKIKPDKPLMAVLPGGGASWGQAGKHRRWSASNYAHLIDKIVENFDAAIILVGDSREVELCRQVQSQAKAALFFAVGQTSLPQMAALFAQCRLAIVNDAGPLHVAVAVGVKTVSIFGPVDPRIYGPYPLRDHQVVQKGLPCQPCYRRFRMSDCGHTCCLGELTVDEVLRKVKNII